MLHIDAQGSGPDLVMVHGWGMHSDVWAQWAGELSAYFRVHRVDLPGHGLSPFSVGDGLEGWSRAVAQSAPSQAWWLGWSLGGLVTLNLARHFPERVRGLTLVASTPRFVASADWNDAVQADVFEQFAAQLCDDPQRTLKRFLALQMRGADRSGAIVRQLQARLKRRPVAQTKALQAGLCLLQDTDLREDLSELGMPLQWLLGARDTLVPAALRDKLPGACDVIEGAGHAPFLSHPGDCTQILLDRLSDNKVRGQHAAV